MPEYHNTTYIIRTIFLENIYLTANMPVRELTAQWLDAALAGLGVAMHSSQNAQGGFLLNGADLGGHVRANLLHAASVALRVTEMVHCEAALSNNLLERDALAALPEVLP